MDELKDIPGYEGRYAVTKDGRVFKHGHFLKHYSSSDHYPRVYIDRNTKYVHRLLALTYLHNPNNLPHVNHINSNKFDFRLENLEWTSVADNITHAWRTGRMTGQLQQIKKLGGGRARAKLSVDDVREIRRLASGGARQVDLARLFNVTPSTIGDIRHGRIWTDVF